MLSEHNCQGWMQGYVLTGRHGVFPCYEAFIPIVDGMVNQYGEVPEDVADEAPWREPVSSLNYLLTSVGWRQDHNGYSHQMPGFINSMLNRKEALARIYLPAGREHAARDDGARAALDRQVNLVIASKHPLPQWLTIDEARSTSRGARRCGTGRPTTTATPTSSWPRCGTIPTIELLAATRCCARRCRS